MRIFNPNTSHSTNSPRFIALPRSAPRVQMTEAEQEMRRWGRECLQKLARPRLVDFKKSDVVSDEVAPCVRVDDEPETEDRFPAPKVIHATGYVVSRERLPFVDFDDKPLCEDEISFPAPKVIHTTGHVVWSGQLPSQLEPDEEGAAR